MLASDKALSLPVPALTMRINKLGLGLILSDSLVHKEMA